MNLTDIKCPKTYEELVGNISKTLEVYKPTPTKPLSPRLFRVSIGVSKYTLSNWKSNPNRQEWFNLIKSHEDILLAIIEQTTIELSMYDGRHNIIGLLNTLRAYDSHRYIPESRQVKNDEQNNLPIVVDLTNKSKLKLTDLAKE